MTNPVLVEVLRGGIVESQHRGAVCVVGPGTRVMFEAGDVERDVYPRSAIKLFQALPLVESGAADAFGFDNAALALACASHNGERRHVAQAKAMLAASNCDHDNLECGPQKPMGSDALWDLAAGQEMPTALHNNCSGKHAGMIATAVHLGEDPTGYVALEHPVQQRIRTVLSDLTDADLNVAPCGIDGCSVPTWALPLRNMASGISRLITGEGLGARHKPAADRLIAACITEPEMTSGAGRRCGQIIRAAGGDAYVKVGAEGVYCGAIPALGIGIALKIDDGGTRAAEVAVSSVLGAILPTVADALTPYRNVTLKNWRGFDVGELQPSAEFLSMLEDVEAS